MAKTVSQIRKEFLEFFKSKNHTVVPSSSLIPVGDPTLLFTTAGMVQFKSLFAGAVELPYTRATSSQKSLRTTDLENVGKTERHCTFFEMLGNFSFGDYFKKEAIEFALEFSLKHLEFDKDKIWITVYLDDDEAIQLWIEQGIPRERIVRLGKEDNFWGPAGDSGACGPCSELYLDRGIERGCGSLDCKPGCSCDRFLEYWNLVFIQFNQDTSKVFHPLKQKGIDTGSGLERVALLIQNVDSVYDTDELKTIILEIEKLSGISYQHSNADSFRVLTDHSRATTFAICDGIYPDRTGRGYVIRRLIRRAALFARKLGIKTTFLYKLLDTVVSIYSEQYPDLKLREAEIKRVILSEETLFLNTLELGLEQLEIILSKYEKSGLKVLSGEDSFKLYSTYGFPPEMTSEILSQRGFSFDKNAFDIELEKDRTLARETWKGKKGSLLTGLSNIKSTEFTGYKSIVQDSNIFKILSNGTQVQKVISGEEGILIFDKTCFYAESGGQIGDVGYIKNGNSVFQVLDTQKEAEVFVHIGKVLSGEFVVGDNIHAMVDASRRELLTYHHSGTHLLNGALRKTLGTHVMQKASLVSNDYLRFDFSHPTALLGTEIFQVEELVNQAIRDSVSVHTKVLPIEEAKKTNAVAAFDEKYGSMVRVVQMGDHSTEFCGGCHVDNTANIKYFLILKESSPGAGNRRIEAVCGSQVVDFFQVTFQELHKKIQDFNLKVKETILDKKEADPLLIQIDLPTPNQVQERFEIKKSYAVKEYRDLHNKVNEVFEKNHLALIKIQKKIESQKTQNLIGNIDEFASKFIEINGHKVLIHQFEKLNVDSIKSLGDQLKNRPGSVVLLFVNKDDSNLTFVFMANKEAIAKGVNCNDLIKSICTRINGRGGGRPDMAQGGGKTEQDASDLLKEIIAQL